MRSPHFVLVTDGGEKAGRAVLLRFEQMRSVFGTIFNKTRVNLSIPLQIVAFRNTQEMIPYAPMWKGQPVSLTGFFQGAEDENFIVLDLSVESGWTTVFHEYAHLLLNANLPPIPPWFDEGFAEYFSTLRFDRKEVQYGQVPEGLPQILGGFPWLKVVDLFGVQHDSSTYNEGGTRSIFYAQSWLVVHWLMSSNKMPQAAQYLQLAQIEKMPISEAIQRAFGMDPAQLDKTLHEYFDGKGKSFRLPAPAMDETTYVVRHLDDLTVQATLADLHAHSKDHRDQAVAEFQRILKEDPENPVANRGLGYSYLSKNDFDTAERYFQQATQRDIRDAQIHYLVALLMNRRAVLAGRPPDNLAEMKRQLQLAIEIDPTLADAYNLLAYADSMSGDYSAAIASIKKAIELNPSKELYGVNLANLYLQTKNWDQAEAVLLRLEKSANPKISQLTAQQMKTLELARQGKATVGIGPGLGVAKNEPTKPKPRDDITAPQWRKTAPLAGEEEKPVVEEAPDTRPVNYLYGKLIACDCSAPPVAVLTLIANGKTMKMRSADYKKMLLIGEDSFSCDWRNRNVLVNYRAGGKNDGDIVTLELK
ncbi:MAG TPA: tetratricopeptide repeat protein [Terriglobales bacterium]|nr:tetratricopeptide repeat protein [Terriglobales bacterium]